MACGYCYIPNKDGEELPTEQWKAIIADLAGYGIFQVTFGGGEPTLREDLKELSLHVRKRGLNLCITTNGLRLPDIGPDTLCLFNQVNASYHGSKEVLWRALRHLDNHQVQGGVNFLVIEKYLPQLPFVALLAEAFDSELLMLTAKGLEGGVTPEKVMAEARKLHEQGIKVAVDGLSCSSEIKDFCMQKRRFCDVDSLGNVLPCSFVRERLGNLLEKPFAEIWRSRGEQVPCPFVGGVGNECGEAKQGIQLGV
jgi:MoaA/NifB/PqqE/SkfB family radical SAM enzyme